MVSNSTLKRILESDSECENEHEEHCGSPLSSNSGSGDSGCFTMARKKRRGLIEKRRRDRINRSLNDLKNLIPTAHERQASAKLEKSEVLSLAVDHIKSLSAKVECSNPQTLAMDYRSIGYQECVRDMVSYLIHGEGLGPTNPLHTRLVSHLHQQLSVYDHTLPSHYLTPPVESSPPMYSTSRTTCYAPVAVCKPEPPISPSYCEAANTNPAEYDAYTRYNTDYNRSQLPNSSNNQWQASPSFTASHCPTSTAHPQYTFTPQSSWV